MAVELKDTNQRSCYCRGGGGGCLCAYRGCNVHWETEYSKHRPNCIEFVSVHYIHAMYREMWWPSRALFGVC